MKVVPQAFYQHPKIEKILVDGLSSIIYKSVGQSDQQNQRYLAAHALTCVLNGTLHVETFDGKFQAIQENQLIFLPKGLYMISDVIPKNENFEAIVFFFGEKLIDVFLSDFNESKGKNSSGTLVFKYNQDLKFFCDTLLKLYRGRKLHQFARPKLLEFLHLVALSQKDNEFVNRLQSIKSRERQNIKSFMEIHFDKPLDVDDYAYLTGRSVSTFQRDFKRRFHISPKKWLIQKRLQKARTLLEESNDTIAQITLRAGYGNTSHFIKEFRKHFGVSPKQFQIRHRKDVFPLR